MKYALAFLGYASAATFELPTITYDEQKLNTAKTQLEAYIPEAQAAQDHTNEAAVEDFGKTLAFGYAYDVTSYAKVVKPHIDAFAAETNAVTFSDNCDVEALGDCIYTATYAEITHCCDFDAEACVRQAGCTVPWMDHPVETEQEIWEAYGDAWENEMRIEQEGWNLFLGKLEDAVDNYTANKAVE